MSIVNFGGGKKAAGIPKEKKAKKEKTPKSANKPKQNGSGKGFRTLKTWQKIVLVTLCVCVIIGLVGVGIIISIMMQAPPLDTSKFEFTSSTVIYDVNGDPYQELQRSEQRDPVTIEQIPEIVQLAFVSVEDQRFYSHNGVDLRGTAKAILGVLTSGSTEGSGGSTITQQLIKLTHLSSEKLITRKLMEWKLAVECENTLTKREILEAYLNKANMSLTWGIQSAANLYFNKDVSELSVAQAAVLAAIVKSPSWYVPYKYDKDEDGNRILSRYTDEDGTEKIGYDADNCERAVIIVDKMYELGHISAIEHEAALSDLQNNNIGLVAPVTSSTYSYFTDAVYLEVLEAIEQTFDYDEDAAVDLLLNGGLKIYSTVDPIIQGALEDQAAKSSNFPSASNAAKNASAAMTKKTGETYEYIPQVGGAVIENETGYVSGIIGGRKKTGSLQLNRALRKFQVGSTTKPITVYAPGVDKGILTLATTFNNVPLRFGSWKIVNTPATYTGMTSVRQAIVGSINIVAVLAQKRVGIDISAEYAEKFGFELVKEGEMNDLNPAAFALGGYTYGQTPLALADAYTVFPNGGYRVTPTFYTRVEDSNGTVILEAEQEKIQVVSESTAWLITSCLKEVVRGGTTTRSVPGQEIGGKTGTTDSNICTWFVGFTPKYTGAFWYGYDEQKVVVDGTTYTLAIGRGGGAADSPSEFWENAFRQFYKEKDLDNDKLPSIPDSVYSAAIDAVSGLAPTELTELDVRGSQVKSEYFARGTYPAEADDMHKEFTVCTVSNLLAGENCPYTKTVVGIVKDPERLYPQGGTERQAGYIPEEEKAAIFTETCTYCTGANTITGFEFSNRANGNSIVQSVSMKSGASGNLYLRTVSLSGAVSAITTESPSYSSSDTDVFTVTSIKGGCTLSAVGGGTATLTASYKYGSVNISRSITVTVEAAPTPPTPSGGNEDKTDKDQ